MKFAFWKKKRVISHYRTRHAETAILWDHAPMMNIAYDHERDIVSVWHGHKMTEHYPMDAKNMLQTLAIQLRDASDRIPNKHNPKPEPIPVTEYDIAKLQDEQNDAIQKRNLLS